MNLYDTNIKNLTCSCKDWTERRNIYSYDDPRRLCKHIIHMLNTEDLPKQLQHYREELEYDQKKEYGFKLSFESIVKFPINNLIMLLHYDWMDVFDERGNRYGLLNSYQELHWAGKKKPIGYEEVESYFMKIWKEIPIALQNEEKAGLIEFIRETVPNKANYYFDFEGDSDSIYYYVYELKIPFSEYMKILREFNDNPNGRDKDEFYSCLHNISYAEGKLEDEFRQMIVKHNEIIIEMYYGELYSYPRDYKSAKKYKEKREFNIKLIEEKRKKELYDKGKEDLEKREIKAKEKGLLLVNDEINLYPSSFDAEQIHYIQKYSDLKNKIMKEYYSKTAIPLKEKKLNISTTKFNKVLKSLNMMTKIENLNENNWIIMGEGLKYGINLMKKSQYMHEEIPDWYKIKALDMEKLQLVNVESNHNIQMTDAVWRKTNFDVLIKLINKEIEKEKNNKPKSLKKVEREEWLKDVECPLCGSKNIHKKDKRKRKNFKVQRYQCMDCKKVFQVKIEEGQTSTLF